MASLLVALALFVPTLSPLAPLPPHPLPANEVPVGTITVAAEDIRVATDPTLGITVVEVLLPDEATDWQVDPTSPLASRTHGTAQDPWVQASLTPGSPTAVSLLLDARVAPDGALPPFELPITSPTVGARILRVEPAAGLDDESDDPSLARAVIGRFAQARSRDWTIHARTAEGSALATWLERHIDLYGTAPLGWVGQVEDTPFSWGGGRRRGARTSIFNVFGGRAAIRETLQLDPISIGDEAAGDDAIPIGEIPGVEVTSHPFAEMRARAERLRGRREPLSLAEFVPVDRFFVHFSRPRDLGAFLSGGTDFIHRLSSTFTGSAFDHDILTRTAARLGMTPDTITTVLESGILAEVAVTLPDLFLIDGTDVTVIARVIRPESFTRLVTLFGLGDLSGPRGFARRNSDGSTAHWALRGSVLLISSSEGELGRALALESSGGVGSLARSDEFHVMLAELPPGEETLAYAYISDPFIRRLTGPEVKIGQARRMRARADLERVAAAALLHRLDVHAEPPTVERLATLGYLPEHVRATDITIDRDGTPRSERYGTARRLRTLDEVRVERVSPEEEEAYREYRSEYSRFWRQFFDPIALRLDSPAPSTLDLEIFVLPLIDNSIYDTVRELIPTVPAGSGRSDGGSSTATMRIPVLDPPPVLSISANLRDEPFEGWVRDFEDVVAQVGIPQELLRCLGSEIHCAVLDGDPVVHVGSSDLAGVLGADFTPGRRDLDTIMIPFMVSAFTRPCRVIVPLTDPERAAAILSSPRRPAPRRSSWDPEIDWVRVGDETRWILTSRMVGMFELRFGIEIEDGFLIVSNIPWHDALERTHPEEAGRIVGFERSPLAGVTMRIDPSVGEQQLAGLFTAAIAQERGATFRSAAHLWPIVAALGLDDVDAAQERHAELFGFTPRAPRAQRWTVDGNGLTSSEFGSLLFPRQPGYRRGDRAFGVLRHLDTLTVSLQLEGTGLRTKFRAELCEQQ